MNNGRRQQVEKEHDKQYLQEHQEEGAIRTEYEDYVWNDWQEKVWTRKWKQSKRRDESNLKRIAPDLEQSSGCFLHAKHIQEHLCMFDLFWPERKQRSPHSQDSKENG